MLPKLLQLPAEIRNLIFEYAVTSEKTIVTFRLDAYQLDSYAEATQPALTRVSRQVRAESLPLWYENDFVLHTEAPKVEDAQRWLRCNHAHLLALRRISLWVRYVPFMSDRAPSQGAIRVSLVRPKKYGTWQVDASWNWVTVVRKPLELGGDAKFMVGKLGDREMISAISTDAATPEDYHKLMTDLRVSYMREKMS